MAVEDAKRYPVDLIARVLSRRVRDLRFRQTEYCTNQTKAAVCSEFDSYIDIVISSIYQVKVTLMYRQTHDG